ncbi:MAG: hypothetical protein H7Y03_00885 [Chitinophagaceae bacterium]|nr:hypothetical protein [Chitinophagaceae bacterium]
MRQYLALAILVLFTACKKDETPLDNSTAPLSIEFDNIAGDKNLQLNTGVYTNAANEPFSVSVFQYFISNVKLTTTDGKDYVVPQDSSYFMINETDVASHSVKLHVPQADYSSLSFIVGVDSLRNTMDISRRTGVLDPASYSDHGMYWGWNSGYIFVKLEGTSSSAPVDASGQRYFRYHIGGFGGYSTPTINNIRSVTIDLTRAGIASVRRDRETNVHLMVDVLKMFGGSSSISIASNPTVMFGPFSVNIADNIPGMFRHDHTED